MRKILLLTAILVHSTVWGMEEEKETGISRIHAFGEYSTTLKHTSIHVSCNIGDPIYECRNHEDSHGILGFRVIKNDETSAFTERTHAGECNYRGELCLLKNPPSGPQVEFFQHRQFSPGSLVGDIQQSILDSDRFWLTIRQKKYSDALKMALSNSHREQQNIWKEAVWESTKERIASLVREEVMEFDKEAADNLFFLVGSFEPLDRNIYTDLRNYSDAQRRRFEQKKSDILQSPALRLVQADLHRLVIDRLLHAA